jgi:DsbC/DsbD-like thiol-disulfide interchange protein
MVLALATVALVWKVEAGDRKSDSKVKANAKASKANEKGEQTVTITLDIEKGWHLYANPVNHNKEFLDAAKTKVAITAKEKLQSVSVKYPVGKTHVDKDTKDKYDIYEGVVKIEATVKRAAGDTSPLEVTIAVQACDSSVCLEPGKVKLTVP